MPQYPALTFQLVKSWLNAEALENISFIFFTLNVFQLPISWLNTFAPRKHNIHWSSRVKYYQYQCLGYIFCARKPLIHNPYSWHIPIPISWLKGFCKTYELQLVAFWCIPTISQFFGRMQVLRRHTLHKLHIRRIPMTNVFDWTYACQNIAFISRTLDVSQLPISWLKDSAF